MAIRKAIIKSKKQTVGQTLVLPTTNQSFWKNIRTNYQILLFLIPGFLFILVFNYFPLYGLTIAFKDYKMMKGILASDWVGFEHFQKIFQSKDFYEVLFNTLRISLLKMIFGFPAPIILALMLNEMKKWIKYKKFLQTLSYLPHFFSWVVLGGILIPMFSATGPINLLLDKFGIDAVNFMGNPTFYLIFLVSTSVWQGLGWGSIVYLAAISGVDEALYEAAEIEGAGRFRKMLSITLPCIMPTIITLLILNMSGILNAGFDQVYNTFNPMVYESSDIIDTYVYRKMQSYDYSLGTAFGLFKSAVAFVLVMMTNWLAGKMSNNEQGIW